VPDYVLLASINMKNLENLRDKSHHSLIFEALWLCILYFEYLSTSTFSVKYFDLILISPLLHEDMLSAAKS